MKSPLRYPGGKTRAIKIIEKYSTQFYPDTNTLVSPFFGGGSFELYMKSKYGCKIIANDLFEPLYTFWKTNQKQVSERVRTKLPVSKDDFQNMRRTIFEETDPIERAAMYFCINRCSFSGSTFCGGFSNEASQKRLTESSIKKLEACDVSDVVFENKDCCEFLNDHPSQKGTLVFADPPYYIESYIYGKDGDLHMKFDHEKFAQEIQKRSDWIITYNDCPYIRNLYSRCRIFEESWSYGMNTSKQSSEIVILPNPEATFV